MNIFKKPNPDKALDQSAKEVEEAVDRVLSVLGGDARRADERLDRGR